MTKPLITIVVPSLNQGVFLDDALTSIFQQEIPVEVFVCDAGSTDNSLAVIHKWKERLAGWRSYPDRGQSAAINEGVAKGTAPYVCWLNSDDWYLAEGLKTLLCELEQSISIPAVYGYAWNINEVTKRKTPIWIESFNKRRLAQRCIISQPATLIRREAWQSVGGLNESLEMAMDYDLWWRLYKLKGELKLVKSFIAVNRDHEQTKTNSQRARHYKEAIQVVRKHYGSVPIKWWICQPYSVWYKTLVNRIL